jgi:4-hydroxy-2-oxoheptanedioate aldolase
MESVEAYERVDETLAMENFEVLLVGATDLSASLGIPGQIHDDRVEQIMSDVASKMAGTGKALASTFGDPEDCRRWIRAGYRMMNVSSVLGLGIQGTNKYYAEFREEFGS